MVFARLLVVLAVAYLLGAIPFGIVVCRPFGKDPRSVGSGRTGGTNVYRTLGLPAALATIALDILKGFLAVKTAMWLLPLETYGTAAAVATALAALAAIVGHNWSVFAGFRGGAGSTPNIGALLAFDPALFLVALAVSIVALLGIRIASVGSLILSATILAGIVWRVVDGALPPATLLYAVGQLAIVTWALRPNLRRLRDGTERRIEFGPLRKSGTEAP
jgi:glycerol-3-phosphate acyltransferase PlsY